MLAYTVDINGNKRIFEMKTGQEIKKGTAKGPGINHNLLTYDEKEGALNEQYNNHLPRVLVVFDCWGSVKRRIGGAPASMYEFARFVSQFNP